MQSYKIDSKIVKAPSFTFLKELQSYGIVNLPNAGQRIPRKRNFFKSSSHKPQLNYKKTY